MKIFKYNSKKIFFIAEAGGNHNGDILKAKKLIDVAKKSGADVVKFQTFVPENLTQKNNKIANYAKNNYKKNISQIELLKFCQLKFEDHIVLKRYAKKKNIDFFSTAFDLPSIDFLSRKISLKSHKIPSGEITNYPLLLEHSLRNHNIILSTGMSTIDEIKNAINLIAYVFLHKGKKIQNIKFPSLSKDYTKKIKKKIYNKLILMHCISNYPTKLKDLNLKAIQLLKDTFKLRVGFSDHSLSKLVPSLAVAAGADIIEKHFTLDRRLLGPDHKSSLTPSELKKTILKVKETEMILGESIKKPNLEEIEVAKIARKKIIAKKEIKLGEIFTFQNLTTKRAHRGLSAINFWKVIGKRSKKNYKPDDII